MAIRKMSSKFSLGHVKAPEQTGPETPANSHLVWVIDVSYSMANDLPTIRQQFVEVLPRIVSPGDAVSVIWFSGAKQCGVLADHVRLNNPADLKSFSESVTRWLRPVGATGFLDPLRLAKELRAKDKSADCQRLIFLSDGWDNCCDRTTILNEDLSPFHQVTVVEYGNYADHQLLLQIAERAGGSLLMSDRLAEFQQQMQDVVKTPAQANRVAVPLDTPAPVGGNAFCAGATPGTVDLLPVKDGQVFVAPGTDVFWVVEGAAKETILSAFRADRGPSPWAVGCALAAAVFANAMKADVVQEAVNTIGDESLMKRYSNCFGKQAYAAFVKKATATASALLTKSPSIAKSGKLLPDEDALSVMDVLGVLARSEEQNMLVLDHPEWTYERTSRARTEVEGDVTPLAFKSSTAEAPLNTLVFNSSRANVSVNVAIDGNIDLRTRLKEVKPPAGAKVPASLEAVQFKSYTIIRDGVLHVDTLPVRLGPLTERLVLDMVGSVDGCVTQDTARGVYLLHLDALPLISRRMVKGMTKKMFADHQVDLLRAQAEAKVAKALAPQSTAERAQAKLEALYDEPTAKYLADQGIRLSGSSSKVSYAPPATKQVEATDCYIANTLKVGIKRSSSLKSVADVQKMIAGKAGAELQSAFTAMSPGDRFMANALLLWKDPLPDDEALVRANQRAQASKTLGVFAAMDIFTLIVGQSWFSDATGLDDNTFDGSCAGVKATVTVEMKHTTVEM